MKPTLFLLHDDWLEGLFGGAKGGGKSEALLLAAAEFVEIPGYAALVLRRSKGDLKQADALIPRSMMWWGRKADWNGTELRWTFPSGATITFGYLEREEDVAQYDGSQLQCILVDELTQLKSEWAWQRLASVLRRKTFGPLASVPTRIRGATNPGGVGHDWVRRRFLPDEYLKADSDTQFSRAWYRNDKDGDGKPVQRFFVPSRVEDNPTIDLDDYDRTLALLPPMERKQLRWGDWKAHSGGRFQAAWWRRFKIDVDMIRLADGEYMPMNEIPRIAMCDPANRKTKASKFTAMGVYGNLGKGRICCFEMVRKQLAVEDIIPQLDKLCARWQPEWVGIEANGFQMALVNEARGGRYEHIPTVREMEPEGKSKLTRATPAIICAEQGLFYLPQDEEWLSDFESEHQQFTGDEKEDAYTDQVDCSAYARIGFNLYAIDSMPLVLGEKFL